MSEGDASDTSLPVSLEGEGKESMPRVRATSPLTIDQS